MADLRRGYIGSDYDSVPTDKSETGLRHSLLSFLRGAPTARLT